MSNNSFKLKFGGKELKADFKNLAEQASGSVLLQYGETTVLAWLIVSPTFTCLTDFNPVAI